MKQRGFTLVEMVIVLAVIGLLASFAYPSYSDYVLRTGRAGGQAMLAEIMTAQERFFSQNQTYVTNLGDGGLRYNVAANAPVLTQDGRYAVTAAACAGTVIANCVLLTATRRGAQVNDNRCGDITLDSRGTKGAAGPIADCW